MKNTYINFRLIQNTIFIKFIFYQNYKFQKTEIQKKGKNKRHNFYIFSIKYFNFWYLNKII